MRPPRRIWPACPLKTGISAVAAPRRYGFHATLKAPFRLADGRDERALADALELFCRTRGPTPVGKLALRVLSDFLVLAPMEPGAVAALAADCVRAFDPFRAPSSAEEIERRRPERLTASEKANLDRWGYPYVMEDYRFHLTLTGRLDEGGRARFGAEIARTVLPAIAEPVEIGDMCLCGQESPETDFRDTGPLRAWGRASAIEFHVEPDAAEGLDLVSDFGLHDPRVPGRQLERCGFPAPESGSAALPSRMTIFPQVPALVRWDFRRFPGIDACENSAVLA